MEGFPKIDRHEIDEGSINQEAVTLVNCIRCSLFTSNGIRKDVNVILYPLHSSERFMLVEGEKLRYMGPDERSISILLSKGAQKLDSMGISEEVTSQGIRTVRKNLF